MLNNIWQNVFIEPLYNALVFLVANVPGHSLAIAVIILTILVKLILFPLNQKSIESQIKLKSLEGDLQKIKEKYTDKAEQSKQTFALYKEKGVNPFSSCLNLLIQLPIIIGLYTVFLKGFAVNADALYSFVHFPEVVRNTFLGFVNVTEPSKVLAIVAGFSQYVMVVFSQNNQKIYTKDHPVVVKTNDFSAQLTKSMATQMKYFLPVLIIVIAWKLSAAVALYWIVSNIVGIAQEMIAKRKIMKEKRLALV